MIYRKILLVILAVLAIASSPSPSVALDGEASVVRGGRLYDNWFRELQLPPPTTPHPLFVGSGPTSLPAADTWRCRVCHGWDYRGDGRGIGGITGNKGAPPAAIIELLKDKAHGYGEWMRESDLADLANFVSRGQIDMDDIVDRKTGRSKGDPAAHEDHYVTICAGCHGRGGESVRDVLPLGDVARNSPFEATHMILNGHPGGNMPPLRILGQETVSGMLAYLQTLPSLNRKASVVRGGRLYDNWQIEIKALPPPVPHPAYPAGAAYANDAPRTWRCKECHGWDYLGNEGNYATGSHATGIKGIRRMDGAQPERIISVLRDPTHRFGAVLKARDLQDLANFISEGQVDMNTAIDRKSGLARGDASRVNDHYGTICASCHGLDGKRIATSPPLGRVARENPWESLHKIINGHPGENMPALRVFDEQLFIDMLAFIQLLPEDR